MKPALVVNDVKTMKHIFGTMSSTGKSSFDILEILYQGDNGIVNCTGERWLEQKQFFVKALKQVGFSNKDHVLEQAVLEECDDLCGWIKNQLQISSTVSVHEILLRTSSDILWTMVTGGMEKPKDSKMVNLIIDYNASLHKLVKSGFVFFSWLKYLAPNWSGYNGYTTASKNIHDAVAEYFAYRKACITSQTSGLPGNVIDLYIQQIEHCKNEESTFYGENGLRHSMMSIVALLIAGSETTAVTMKWLIFYISVHPEVQQKLHMEIDNIIGTKDPSLSDKQRFNSKYSCKLLTFSIYLFLF